MELSVTLVANLFGVSRPTIYQWIKEGRLQSLHSEDVVRSIRLQTIAETTVSKKQSALIQLALEFWYPNATPRNRDDELLPPEDTSTNNTSSKPSVSYGFNK